MIRNMTHKSMFIMNNDAIFPKAIFSQGTTTA